MITVHHLNNSRSQRVLWLLEELGVPYEIAKYQRDPKTMLAPASLRAIHPLGKSPVIVDRREPLDASEARPGLAIGGDATVAESGAILEYLVETYGNGKLAPAAGTQAHRDYRYFLHYAEGSLMPLLLMKLVFGKVKSDAPFLVRPIASAIAGMVGKQFIDPNLEAHAEMIANHLSGRTWFAGDELSAADVQMSFPVEALVARGGVTAPPVTAWLARIHERPAYKKALERGGEYQILGK